MYVFATCDFIMLFHYFYFVSLAHWAHGIVNEENQAKYLTPGNKIKYLPTTKFGFHQSSFQVCCRVTMKFKLFIFDISLFYF